MTQPPHPHIHSRLSHKKVCQILQIYIKPVQISISQHILPQTTQKCFNYTNKLFAKSRMCTPLKFEHRARIKSTGNHCPNLCVFVLCWCVWEEESGKILLQRSCSRCNVLLACGWPAIERNVTQYASKPTHETKAASCEQPNRYPATRATHRGSRRFLHKRNRVVYINMCYLMFASYQCVA